MKDWKHSEELENEICDRIAEGESLRAICQDDNMPGRRTVMEWIETNEAFRAKYARARVQQAEWLNDDMAEIEESVLRGRLDTKAAQVVLGSKQWRAAKLAPKRYGERIASEISGPDGGPVKTDNSHSLPPEVAQTVLDYAAKLREKIKPTETTE